MDQVCFPSGWRTTILDSLVVRISACHVEGPGSIPGRGGNFFEAKMARIVYLNITMYRRPEISHKKCI